MTTDVAQTAEIEGRIARTAPINFAKTPPLPNAWSHKNGAALNLTGRRLIERRATQIARNWRARRSLFVRDLDPSVVDAMKAWAQAEARLELADEAEAWGERWVTAAQSGAARLRRELEKTLKENPPLPSLLSRRTR